MRPCEEASTEEHRTDLCDLFLRGGISEKEFKEILPTIDKKTGRPCVLCPSCVQ